MRHLAAIVIIGLTVPALAQNEADTEAFDAKVLDAELEEYRAGLFTMFNEANYEEMLKQYCHEDIIAIWQDGNTSKGHAEVLAEFAELAKIIDRIQLDPTIEERVVRDNGRMVISSGKLNDTYALKRGETVALESVWSATLIKEDDKWLMLNFNGAANAFDNNVIRLYFGEARRRFAGIAAIGGLVVGLVCWGAASRFRKRSN